MGTILPSEKIDFPRFSIPRVFLAVNVTGKQDWLTVTRMSSLQWRTFPRSDYRQSTDRSSAQELLCTLDSQKDFTQYKSSKYNKKVWARWTNIVKLLLFFMTPFDENFWWKFLMTIFGDDFWWQFLVTIFDDNFWWQFFMTFFMTIFDDNCWWQFLMTIFDYNFWWKF